MSLALWLRAGRAQKGLSLEDVAKITKIQPRILERLEAGKLDGLPAEVFVRGFIRSVAKCVGLDESEALVRYSAAQGSPTTIPTATPSAVAFVESMSDLAPSTASVLAPVVLVSNPPTAWAAASNQGLPALEELDDVEIDVDVEPVMLAHAPTIEVVDVAKNEVSEPIVAPIVVEPAVASTSIEVVEATIASVEAPSVATAPTAPTAPTDATAVDAAPVETNGKKKRTRKPRGTAAPKGKRKAMATGTPSGAMPIVAAPSDAMDASVDANAVDAKSVDANVVDANVVDASVVDANVVDANVVDANVVEANAVVDANVVDANVANVVDAKSVDTATIENASVEHASTIAVGSVGETSAADALFGAATATMIDSTELVDVTDAASVNASADTAMTADSSDNVVATSGTWKPSMPTVTTSSVPWRRPALGIYATSTAPVIPTLVIDDADPESAEREQEDRAQAHVPRKSFLPPILAERAKNAASGQGTLTLAVIILLIAATLTLSYLMRRPSSSGDGVTRTDGIVELVG